MKIEIIEEPTQFHLHGIGDVVENERYAEVGLRLRIALVGPLVEQPKGLRLVTRHALLTYARKHWPRWQSGGLAGLLWTEASLRQAWAAVRGDRDSAKCYGELRRLVGDVCQGRSAEVRRRIRQVAAFLDPIAAEQDGRTV